MKGQILDDMALDHDSNPTAAVVNFNSEEAKQVIGGRRARVLKDKRKKFKPGSFGAISGGCCML